MNTNHATCPDTRRPSPEQIAVSKVLSRAQKVLRLREWELDLRQSLEAEAEGMDTERLRSDSDLLRRVRRSIRALTGGDPHDLNFSDQIEAPAARPSKPDNPNPRS